MSHSEGLGLVASVVLEVVQTRKSPKRTETRRSLMNEEMLGRMSLRQRSETRQSLPKKRMREKRMT